MCCVDKDKDMRELADKVHEYTQFRDDLRQLVDEQWKDVCAPDELCDACNDMREFLFKIEKLLNGGE